MKLFKKQSKASPVSSLPTTGRQPASQRGREPQRRPTFSYAAARSQTELNTGRETVQSKQPLRRLPSKLKRLQRHSAWLIGFVCALAVILYQLQLSTNPRVVTLATNSDVPLLQDSLVYQDAAHKLFDGSAANRNKLTVSANSIAAELQRQFPELQEVSISLPILGDQPTVYVRPADPALVLAANNGSFIVDDNGRALAEATTGTNLQRLNIPTVTDQSNLSVKLGQQVLPRSATVFISTVVQQLKAQKISVQSMTLPAAAGELNVYIADRPYFVRYNLQATTNDAASVQTGTFIAVNKRLGREGTIPSQYVDVRLEGRAYYK